MNETCNFCGAEYHRIEDHCCHCTSLLQPKKPQAEVMKKDAESMGEKHQYAKSACKFCGLHPQIAFWCDGSAYVRCQQWNVSNGINHGPAKATEREAVDAWNKLQEPNVQIEAT